MLVWEEERALLYRALRACRDALEQTGASEEVLSLVNRIIEEENRNVTTKKVH